MSDVEKVENTRASSEARETAARAAASSTTEAVDAALKRYLAAEQYHEGSRGPAEGRGAAGPASRRLSGRAPESTLRIRLRQLELLDEPGQQAGHVLDAGRRRKPRRVTRSHGGTTMPAP